MKLERSVVPRWVAVLVAFFIIVLVIMILLASQDSQSAEEGPAPSGAVLQWMPDASEAATATAQDYQQAGRRGVVYLAQGSGREG